MSTYTPTDAELQFARDVLAAAPGSRDLLPHFLIGMLRSQLGMTESALSDVSAEQMVRNCRAAILVYDEIHP